MGGRVSRLAVRDSCQEDLHRAEARMLGVERCIGRSLIARGLLTGADVGTPRMLRNGCHVGRLRQVAMVGVARVARLSRGKTRGRDAGGEVWRASLDVSGEAINLNLTCRVRAH
jgi:hypothetical protein